MGDRELVCDGDGVTAWEDERVLEMTVGDGCTRVKVFAAAELNTYRWFKWHISCYVYFSHF